MKTVLASFIALFLSATTVGFAGNTVGEKAPFQSSVIALPSHMKIDVVVQNQQDASLTIRLVDQLGITQATKKLGKDTKTFRTRFDISALSDGIYRVIVSDGTNTQTQEINLATHVPTPAVYRTISVS